MPDLDVNAKVDADIVPFDDLKVVGAHVQHGVWPDLRPAPPALRKNALWLWLRRSSFTESDTCRECVRVDLENLDRSAAPKKDQGRVLYCACFAPSPVDCEVQQTTASHRGDALLDSLQEAPAGSLALYINHLSHLLAVDATKGVANYHRPLDGCIVSQWTATFKVRLSDGDLSRGKDFFSADKPLSLQIYATGAAVTSYYETKVVKYKETVNKKVKREVVVVNTHKVETRLVDTLNYRLFSGEEIVAEWNAEGDTYTRSSGDVLLDTPLFTARLQGGWLSRCGTHVATKPESDVDGALALLIAHIVSAELSVQEIKKYIKIDTPNKPPEDKTATESTIDSA